MIFGVHSDFANIFSRGSPVVAVVAVQIETSQFESCFTNASRQRTKQFFSIKSISLYIYTHINCIFPSQSKHYGCSVSHLTANFASRIWAHTVIATLYPFGQPTLPEDVHQSRAVAAAAQLALSAQGCHSAEVDLPWETNETNEMNRKKI